jgi:formate hydrogenlyase subunit 3/multisubunit Na+/H+ antiporter MnhD subunit
MLRLVPPGSPGTEAFGPVLLGFGLFSAFAAALLGLAQQHAKVVLAYSTVSQMGLVLAMYAALLMVPESAPLLLPWLGLLVLHHGFNKAALFLACGCAPGRSRARMALVALPALSIAGAPLSSGMYAKTGLKQGLAAAGLGSGWALLLGISSLATTLLLWHFWRLLRQDRHYRPAHPAWIGMTLTGFAVPWFWGLGHGLDPDLVHGFWPALWPLLAAAVLVWTATRVTRIRIPGIPAGDLVVPLETAVVKVAAVLHRLAHPDRRFRLNLYPVHVRITMMGLWLERKMSALPVAGALILAMGGLLWWVARLGQ